MKLLVVLLGLIAATLLSGKGDARQEGVESWDKEWLAPSIQLTGVAAVTVRIRAYNATGEVDISKITSEHRDAFTLGTRVLLTCDLTIVGSEVPSYRWYHNCTKYPNGGCEIQDRDPYYRVVSDTLLVDVTSWDQGGWYFCVVHYLQEAKVTNFTAVKRTSVAG